MFWAETAPLKAKAKAMREAGIQRSKCMFLFLVRVLKGAQFIQVPPLTSMAWPVM